MKKELIDQAVWNNAVWCDLVCRTNGNPGIFGESLWYCPQKAPPFYPNSITLNRSVTDAIFDTIQASLDEALADGWGIKDSFANLELSERGFRALFDAEWLHLHQSKTVSMPELPTVHWEIIADNLALTHWEQALAGLPANETESRGPQIFQPALLADKRLSIIAAYKDHKIVAGVIGLLTDDVVGVSNIFRPREQSLNYRAGCISKLQAIYPNKSLVGYEGGDDLKEMLALGFQQLGPLRIWVRDSAPA